MRVKTGGRAKGTPNKVSAILRDAVVKAATDHGRDGEGKDGLAGYCHKLAASEPRAFASLLGRMLPTQHQLAGEDGGPIETKDVGNLDLAKAVASILARGVKTMDHGNKA